MLRATNAAMGLRALNLERPTLNVVDLITCQGALASGPEPWTVSGTYATIAYDNTVTPVRGTNSLLITAITNAATATLTYDTDVNIRGGLSFQIMCENAPTTLSRVELRFHEDTGGTAYNYFYCYYDGQRTNNMSTTNTWYTVHVPLIAAKASGTPTAWTNLVADKVVRRIKVLVTPKTDATCKVWIGSMQAVSASKAICLVRFDDGIDDQYDVALPIMETYRIRGAFHVNATNMGGLFVTADQWKEMAALGHAIGNHTMSGLTIATATEAQRDYEVVMGNKRLQSLVGVTAKSFVYPGNNGHAAGMADWMSSLGLHNIAWASAWRNLTGNQEPGYSTCYIVYPINGQGLVIPIDWQNLPHVAGYSYPGYDETGALLLGYLESAIVHKNFISFYTHGITVSPTSNDTYTSTFTTVMAYLAAQRDAGNLWIPTPQEYYDWAVAENAKINPSINWLH